MKPDNKQVCEALGVDINIPIDNNFLDYFWLIDRKNDYIIWVKDWNNIEQGKDEFYEKDGTTDFYSQGLFSIFPQRNEYVTEEFTVVASWLNNGSEPCLTIFKNALNVADKFKPF